MRKVFISMLMLKIAWCSMGMNITSDDKSKLDRIDRLSVDIALGQGGRESELFHLSKEFKHRQEKEFYTARMLYVRLVLSGFGENELLTEAIDILVEMAKKMESDTFFNPLLSDGITWKATGLRDTLVADLLDIRSKYKKGDSVLKLEERFKKELFDVLVGKINSIEELIDSESGSSD